MLTTFPVVLVLPPPTTSEFWFIGRNGSSTRSATNGFVASVVEYVVGNVVLVDVGPDVLRFPRRSSIEFDYFVTLGGESRINLFVGNVCS